MWMPLSTSQSISFLLLRNGPERKPKYGSRWARSFLLFLGAGPRWGFLKALRRDNGTHETIISYTYIYTYIYSCSCIISTLSLSLYLSIYLSIYLYSCSCIIGIMQELIHNLSSLSLSLSLSSYINTYIHNTHTHTPITKVQLK